MNTTPAAPNYVVIYWLEYERTGDHTKAAAAVEQAMKEHEAQLIQAAK